MSAIELTGAIAASCSANAASTSSVVWRPIHSWMIASSSSACSTRPVWLRNHGSSTRSSRPTIFITRSAID